MKPLDRAVKHTEDVLGHLRRTDLSDREVAEVIAEALDTVALLAPDRECVIADLQTHRTDGGQSR